MFSVSTRRWPAANLFHGCIIYRFPLLFVRRTARLRRARERDESGQRGHTHPQGHLPHACTHALFAGQCSNLCNLSRIISTFIAVLQYSKEIIRTIK